MCGGGRARSPKVEYVGPSEEDIERQEEQLEAYRQQSQQQTEAFQAQLQKQMEDAQRRQQQMAQQYASRDVVQEERARAAASAKNTEDIPERPDTVPKPAFKLFIVLPE